MAYSVHGAGTGAGTGAGPVQAQAAGAGAGAGTGASACGKWWCWLTLEYIQSRPANAALAKGCSKRGFINDIATCRINEASITLHHSKALRIYDMVGLRACRAM